MKKNTLGIFILCVVIAAVGCFAAVKTLHFHGSTPSHAAIYYCPMHPTYTSDRPGTCPICNMSLVKREDAEGVDETMESGSSPQSGHQHAAAAGVSVEYTCPMHPQIVSDKPGDCPICHMRLVPKNQSAEPSENQAAPREFTVEQLMSMKPGEICLLHKCKMGQCMMAMTEEMARVGKCPHCHEDLGVIIKNAAPEGYAKIKLGQENQEILGLKTAPVQKKNMEKVIRTVGQIAYDPELYQAQEEYLQAVKASQKADQSSEAEIKEQALKLIESSKIKLRLLGLNDDLIQEIEKNGKPDRSLLYSDQGGTVWLYAPIYEYELMLVKAGDSIEAEIPTMMGKKMTGVIRSIDSVIDPMTRSAKVRAVLQNPESALRPGMYVNASINIAAGDKLVVPTEAVFATGEKNIVFVARDKGVFEPREVVLGLRTDSDVEIRSGVGEGELVVTSGNFLIDSESRLKAALQSMEPQSAGGHQHGA